MFGYVRLLSWRTERLKICIAGIISCILLLWTMVSVRYQDSNHHLQQCACGKTYDYPVYTGVTGNTQWCTREYLTAWAVLVLFMLWRTCVFGCGVCVIQSWVPLIFSCESALWRGSYVCRVYSYSAKLCISNAVNYKFVYCTFLQVTVHEAVVWTHWQSDLS